MAAFPDGDESSGLDRILKNTEFENTQQAKAIETEKERIQVYQKELEVKQRLTKELEESTFNLDEHAKSVHKQFKLSRENYESLKRTSAVLDEHDEALQRKLKATIHDCKQQRIEQQEALSKYENLWATYQAKYEGFLKAQELNRRSEELEHVRGHSVGLEKQIKEMESSLSELHLENGHDDTLAYVLQIASLRVSAMNNMNTAKVNLQATDSLQQEIVELEGRIAKAAESLKQEAVQQKAVTYSTPIESPHNTYVNPTQTSRPSTSTPSPLGDAIDHNTSPNTTQPAVLKAPSAPAVKQPTSTSRYMLAIPQLSIPPRSTSTTSQTPASIAPRRSPPSVQNIPCPASYSTRSANSQLKIPSLQTPSRPSHTDQSKQQPPRPTPNPIRQPPRPIQQPAKPLTPPSIQQPPRPPQTPSSIQQPPTVIQQLPNIQRPPRPTQTPTVIQRPPRVIQQPPKAIQQPTSATQQSPIEQPSGLNPCVSIPTIQGSSTVQPVAASDIQPFGTGYTSKDIQPKEARQAGTDVMIKARQAGTDVMIKARQAGTDVMIEQDPAPSEPSSGQLPEDLPPEIAVQPHDVLPESNETIQQEQQLTYPEYDMQQPGAQLDMSFGQFLAVDMGQTYNNGGGMLYQQQDFDNMMSDSASGSAAQGGFFFGDTSNAGAMSGFDGGIGFGQFGGDAAQTPASGGTGMNFDLFGGSASGQGQGGFAFSFGGGGAEKSGTGFSFF